MSYAPKDPQYWRNWAEEAWAMASEMKDAHCKAILVDIAHSYDDMVRWLEESAHQPTWPTAISRTGSEIRKMKLQAMR